MLAIFLTIILSSVAILKTLASLAMFSYVRTYRNTDLETKPKRPADRRQRTQTIRQIANIRAPVPKQQHIRSFANLEQLPLSIKIERKNHPPTPHRAGSHYKQIDLVGWRRVVMMRNEWFLSSTKKKIWSRSADSAISEDNFRKTSA